jgi:hypothetical protein
MARGSETVYIQPEQAKDAHGDPVGVAPEPVQVDECVVWPRSSTEEGRGEVIIDGLNVYMPPETAVLPGPKDDVIARGERYAVDGVPGEYINKGGAEKGTIVVLKRRST